MTNFSKFKFNQWFNKYSKTMILLIEDLALIVGYLCFCYGIHQIYKPAMWIFLGFGIMKLGGTK
jgi:hypothetical protein